MNLNELTERDLDTLIEAMEVWEKQPQEKGFTGMMLGAMLGGLGPEEGRERRLEESERKMKREMENADNEVKMRKRLSIILRAKLEIARSQVQHLAIQSADAITQ